MLQNPLKWMRNRSKPVWKVIVHKAAIILLVAALGLGSVMVVSPTARAAVIRWVMELYETHIVYRFYGEPIAGKMPDYVISKLPGGFFEVDCFETDAYVSVFYQDLNGDYICFDYFRAQEGISEVVTTQDNVKAVTVNGLEGQMFLPTDTRTRTTVLWIDPRVNIRFSVDSILEPAAVMDMAESICLEKEKK